MSTYAAYQEETAAPAQLVRGTKAFRLNIHVESESVADQARDVAEKTWEIAADIYGAQLPNKPLDAVLYRTAADYEAADQKLTGGRFKRNLAFARGGTLTAHVALQPYLTDSGLEEVGLPKQSAQLLAHEMAHLVRYHWMPHSMKDHPQWLLHGIATWIDKKVMRELDYMSDPTQDPDIGKDIQNVLGLLEQEKLPSVASLLDDDKLDVGFFQSYGVRWMLVDMLMTKHEKKFRAFMKDFRRLGGGRDFPERTTKMLLENLGVEIKQLEAEFVQHIKSQKPVWVDVIRSLETGGDVWHQIAFPKSNATAWNQRPLPDSCKISIDAEILSGTGNQLNLRLGQADSFTQFSLTAGYGINVFEFKDKKWQMTFKKKLDNVVAGRPMKLQLVRNKELQFLLDGEVIFEGELKENKELKLGLGAQKGSVVAWRDLKVEDEK